MVIVAIGISTLSFLIETLPTFNNSNYPVWSYIEACCIALFTLEFIIRFSTCPDYLLFCRCTSSLSCVLCGARFARPEFRRAHTPSPTLLQLTAARVMCSFPESSGLPGHHAVLHRADGSKRKLVHLRPLPCHSTRSCVPGVQDFSLRVVDSGRYHARVLRGRASSSFDFHCCGRDDPDGYPRTSTTVFTRGSPSVEPVHPLSLAGVYGGTCEQCMAPRHVAVCHGHWVRHRMPCLALPCLALPCLAVDWCWP